MSKSVGGKALTRKEDMVWIKKKKKAKEDIPQNVNEDNVFLVCSRLTTDKFWINKMLQAHNGKFPKGIRAINGKLIYRKKTKTECINIPTDTNEAFDAIKKFFLKHGVNQSSVDIKKQEKLIQKELSKVIELKCWKDVKGLKTQNALLYDFATRKQNEMNLTDRQASCLIEIINIGIYTDCINPDKDIKFENDRIKTINGLVFNGRKFRISEERIKRLKKVSIFPSGSSKRYFDKSYVPPNVRDRFDIDSKWEEKYKSIYKKIYEARNINKNNKAKQKKKIRVEDGIVRPSNRCKLAIVKAF